MPSMRWTPRYLDQSGRNMGVLPRSVCTGSIGRPIGRLPARPCLDRFEQMLGAEASLGGEFSELKPRASSFCKDSIS